MKLARPTPIAATSSRPGRRVVPAAAEVARIDVRPASTSSRDPTMISGHAANPTTVAAVR